MTEELVTADISKVSGWGDDDPTVFLMTIGARMQGEFQVTNGYGPHKAPQVMKVTLIPTLFNPNKNNPCCSFGFLCLFPGVFDSLF